MKGCAVLVLTLLVAFVAARPDQYTDRYDSFDVDKVLKSDRLIKNYCDCLESKGPCTPEGTELKRVLPDALETKCSKCTPKQEENSKKVINFLVNNKKDCWGRLAKIYDPENKYTEEYRETAKEQGIDLDSAKSSPESKTKDS